MRDPGYGSATSIDLLHGCTDTGRAAELREATGPRTTHLKGRPEPWAPILVAGGPQAFFEELRQHIKLYTSKASCANMPACDVRRRSMRGRCPIRPWSKSGGAPCSGLKRAKVPSSWELAWGSTGGGSTDG